MVNILLTTFPSHSTRNVGDDLITQSAIKLVQYRVPSYDPLTIFRDEPLDSFLEHEVKTILAPGFSVTNGTYPNKFKLCESFESVANKIFAVGCSFQNWLPLCSTYHNYDYNKETLSVLERLAGNYGVLPCRDDLIVEMLNNNGVPSAYCGDLALYDDTMIGLDFNPPSEIKSIAVTIQHKRKFLGQSKKLLNLLRRDFSEAELYIVHHSTPTKNSIEVAEYAKSIGFKEKDLSGGSQSLNFYDDVDLHVGYRLHGHIAFLRRRKPSVLIVEDARSFGISQTGTLNIGTFLGVLDDGSTVDKDAPGKAVKFLRLQAMRNFSLYNRVFTHIDNSYTSFVRPYFDHFAQML